jgi:hypothetical protein
MSKGLQSFAEVSFDATLHFKNNWFAIDGVAPQVKHSSCFELVALWLGLLLQCTKTVELNFKLLLLFAAQDGVGGFRPSICQDSGTKIQRNATAARPVDTSFPVTFRPNPIAVREIRTASLCEEDGILHLEPLHFTTLKEHHLSYAVSGWADQGWRVRPRSCMRLTLHALSPEAAAALVTSSTGNSNSGDALAATYAALHLPPDDCELTLADWTECSELLKSRPEDEDDDCTLAALCRLVSWEAAGIYEDSIYLSDEIDSFGTELEVC